jgi:hypothetical protein
VAEATVKFRRVHEREGGITVRQWTEYSVREVTISVLNVVSLSSWSPWRKWDDLEVVDQNGSPL